MANIVDPDQTAPIAAVCSGSTLFASILKETRSVTMNKFQKKLFSFKIICKNRIKLCFHNKHVQYC